MTTRGTIGRDEMAKAIRREIGLSLSESGEMVQCILRHMCEALSRGEVVKIRRFGTFRIKRTPPRIGRNPSTLEEHVIPARRVLKFAASVATRTRVAGDR